MKDINRNHNSPWKIIRFLAIALPLSWLIWNYGLKVYAVEEPVTAAPSDCQGTTRFALIGDFGDAGQAEASMAALVDSWDVDFIATVGDNNYPAGEASTIDQNVGQYFHSYIHPYQGSYGPGAAENRFFPALGNHDWRTDRAQPYFDYFTLPGNERYYDLERGPVHLFIVDSDPNEPDGRTRDSVQAVWLRDQLAAADAPWRLVLMHHSPYSSSLKRGPDEDMQWPFAEWGATAVLSGHDHLYERLQAEGIPYFINGLGGRSNINRFFGSQPESVVRYNRDFGAMLITADDTCLNFSFYSVTYELIDSLTLYKGVPGK